MNIPTLYKARNLKQEDINVFRLQLSYAVLIVGITSSLFTTLLNLIPTFILFCILIISAVDWSVD